ncbi:MAG: alpha-L-rhamnosidase N-terminal domain-containing protein [Rhodothermales bacterium]
MLSVRLLLVFLSIALVQPARAQQRRATQFEGAPAAAWIAPPDADLQAFGVYHFRRTFELAAAPAAFIVHVSADNRYRLFVNGEPVSSGPQRSDLMHWRYETVDLAPYLHAGSNVIAALVWNWGSQRPVAQHSYRTGFLLQGNSPAEAVINTDATWKVFADAAYAPIAIGFRDVGGYYASPPGEEVDGARYPWGWETAGFDDTAWPQAQGGQGFGSRFTQLRGQHPNGEAGAWQLTPRTIPPMEEAPVRFARVRRAEGVAAGEGFLTGAGDLVIPPNTEASLVLDQGHLTNAYAILETSAGAGSTITLTYAESGKDEQGRKGNRNELEGKRIAGVRDVFHPDGGDHRRFQTLWFRTYRYVQLDVKTADQPLRIHDLHGLFTGYPFELKARFDSDLPWLADVWTMNWRGARLCAWETFFDTPYYEQLQYIGDTRIQALMTLYMSGDDRLMRQAITHFNLSRIPEGITNSRYPSELGQYIPPFSLLYVAMVHDYWMYRSDADFVRNLVPGIESVLAWFEAYIDDTGMMEPLPWWPYVDWAWPGGRPPGANDGHSAMITLQYVYALQRAADLEDALGLPAAAARYRTLAADRIADVRARAWVAERGLFRDAPESDAFSQQTNVMAVLTDAVPAAEQHAVMERVLADTSLTQSTYYYSFYVFEALRKAGMADRYIEQLAPWQEMLAMGLTTTPETPEPTRSDSHAWAAHPNYGLLATVLGIRPASPGFATVEIAPALGPLKRAEGVLPVEQGDIRVKLERRGTAGVQAEIVLPDGLSGSFVWAGQRTMLRPGRQTLSL